MILTLAIAWRVESRESGVFELLWVVQKHVK
jgi:hypothetical protein